MTRKKVSPDTRAVVFPRLRYETTMTLLTEQRSLATKHVIYLFPTESRVVLYMTPIPTSTWLLLVHV